RVSTLDERIRAQQDAPIPTVLRAGFAVAILVVGLLTATAILIVGRSSAARRRELAYSLHRLGASRRTIAATLAVEGIPSTLVAVLAGVVAGLGIPFLILAAVDLGPLVGGIAPPRFVVDPFAVLTFIG